MGGICCEDMFAEYYLELSLTKNGMTAWELIQLVGMHFKDVRCQTLSMGITDVYEELILDILKQV